MNTIVLEAPAEPLDAAILVEQDAVATPEAAEVLESLFNWVLKARGEEDGSTIVISDEVEPVGEGQIVEVSLAVLDNIDDLVGWLWESELPHNQLNLALSQIISVMTEIEIEYDGKRVLIEQADVASLDEGDIGLWTNLMADGSSISIVGNRDMLDDLQTAFG